MSSSDDPTDQQHPDEAVGRGRPTTDPEALRQLADRLHQSITRTLEDWIGNADATSGGARSASPGFSRPVSVPPVRMAQMSRTPEPTADLDDLVDLLVPRLVERLTPALREALRDDD
jgi:hypothetical protein